MKRYNPFWVVFEYFACGQNEQKRVVGYIAEYVTYEA